jgi:rhomboid protease GluP
MTEQPAPQKPPATWVTYALIAANVAMFAFELAMGADAIHPTPQKMIELGGDFAPLTLHGEWWRLGTSMFLHYGLAHIAMNMLVLYQARVVEVLYGRAGFAALYLASGLLGGVVSLWHAQNVVSAGASGAVFGVFGALGAVLVLRRDELNPAFFSQGGRSLVLFIGINLAYGMSQKGIDLSAHIGGLGAGFVAGGALLLGARHGRPNAARAIVIAVVSIAATAGGLRLVPTSDPLGGDRIAKRLDELHSVEDHWVAMYENRFNELQAKGKDAIRADEIAFADMIDNVVLPPWKTIRARAYADTDIPVPLARLFEIEQTYVSDQEDAWSAYAAWLRYKGQTKLDLYNQKAAAVRQDLTERAAEYDRLK